jgi:hypothetical protein
MRLPTSREPMSQEIQRSVRKKFNGGPAVYSRKPFDITSLESEAVTKLFNETTSHQQKIRIEVVANGREHRGKEEHPAATTGLTTQSPTVQFADSLEKGQRIEAIAHELAHLLLVYRYGLGVIGRRIPRPGNREDIFKFFMSMRGDWVYLLGQIANTAHHLVLTDYLKEEYGIEDRLHTYLLHQNFCIAVNDNVRDKESQYGMGVVAFEYQKLIGRVDRVINIHCQTEFFWKGYLSAQKYFDKYSFRSVPAPSSYQEDILSFLEDLGYERHSFVFFPDIVKDPTDTLMSEFPACGRQEGAHYE